MDCYSTQLDEALVFVADAFRRKRRKGSGIPYLTHLLEVMVLVAEHGGDEEQMIAALLHDYLEDIPGATTAGIAERFGQPVADLVLALSDATSHPKPPWEERKRGYLAELRTSPARVRLVSAADKLHNARSVRRDLATLGEAVFDRFSATREQTLWYYGAVVEALAEGWEHPLLDLLRAEVEGLHREAGGAGSGPDPVPV